MAEIDQEMASCEAVLARLPVGSPDRPRHLRELAGLLGTRYASQRELPDLERIVQLYEQARTLVRLLASVGWDGARTRELFA